MKILLIGPQGSGKSTQARLLSEYLSVPVISTGEIFRNLSSQETEEGKRVKQILGTGKLVDDETTSKIVEARLKQSDCQNGFIIDGYPRNIEQANTFDPDFERAFYLHIPEEKVLERLLKRGRADDTKELIKQRLDLYYRQTQPLLDYYRSRGILVEIDGRGDIQKVQDEIKKSL